jgi:predicted nucleic-acid-binding Zn-ribbon protein
MAEHVCPKCGNAMEPGSLSDGGGFVAASGKKKTQRGGLLVYLGLIEDTGDARPIVADRCRSCGYLELYAPN